MLKSTKFIVYTVWVIAGLAMLNNLIVLFTKHMDASSVLMITGFSVLGGLFIQMWALNRDLKIKYGKGFNIY